MKMLTTVFALVLVASSNLGAQATPEGPRAGAWGAEVGFDVNNPGAGAALVRFLSDRSALLLGLGGSFSDREIMFLGGGGEGFTMDRRMVHVDARLGYRAFRSPGSAVRPIAGGGILGSMEQTTGLAHSWTAGAYGELGIMRFFGPSFSVGATAELQVRRTAYRADHLDPVDFRIGFDAVRIAAMVVF